MKTRVLTSLLIVAIVLPPILMGGWLLELLAFLVITLATVEWMENARGYRKWKVPVCSFIILWTLLEGNFPAYQNAIFAGGLILIWSAPIFFSSFEEEDALFAISFMMIVSMAYNGIQALIPHHLYLLTICLANYGSDTGAYLAGRMFGKHKMAPRISPKKTWEGFFGGWLTGTVLSIVISTLYNKTLNPALNLAVCLSAPAIAALGDLCFSAFKRSRKIKDFSSLLPGHGGLLDRLDSLILNLIFFNILYALF